MEMADVGGAERLGARLIGEVEECGLGELLASLRTLVIPDDQNKIFNVPELDSLLSTPQPIQIQQQQQQQHHHRSDDDTWVPNHEARNDLHSIPLPAKKRSTPVIELVSPPHAHHPSPPGKTALLYLLTIHAILPSTLSSVPLSGLTSSIIIFDPLHHFSVSFLATTLLAHIASSFTAAGKDATSSTARREILPCVKQALNHVHIFRPASWDALLATLRSLETYLFDTQKHSSTHRPVHALVLDDVDAFLPVLRTASSAAGGNAIATASAQLTRLLDTLSTTLSCAVLTTSHSTTHSSFRPPLPLRWPANMQITRLAVRRVEVVKFAPGMSVDEAEAEREQRGEVVGRGRVEVRRVGSGGEGEGVVIRVGQSVSVERDGG